VASSDRPELAQTAFAIQTSKSANARTARTIGACRRPSRRAAGRQPVALLSAEDRLPRKPNAVRPGVREQGDVAVLIGLKRGPSRSPRHPRSAPPKPASTHTTTETEATTSLDAIVPGPTT